MRRGHRGEILSATRYNFVAFRQPGYHLHLIGAFNPELNLALGDAVLLIDNQNGDFVSMVRNCLCRLRSVGTSSL